MENRNTQIKINLQSFGLSEKEVDVYVALLELGKGSVTKISQKAGINRTTGYDILGSLVNKKLVSVSGKEPKQEYAAEPPTAITEYLRDEYRKQRNSSEKQKRSNRSWSRFMPSKIGLESASMKETRVLNTPMKTRLRAQKRFVPMHL